MKNQQHQTCKTCGRIQRFEFSVSDELWKRSGCAPEKARCIECWLEKLDDSDVPEISIDDFQFLGIVGDRIQCVLRDARN